MEFWYDPNHTGALRIIDYKNNYIYGSDPKESTWCVTFDVLQQEKKCCLIVDFHKKKTHHGKKIMRTTYEDRNMTLHWEDGNKWRRMKQDPRILLNALKR
jgi:hypothetical protein